MGWLTEGEDVDVVHNRQALKDEPAHHLEDVGVLTAHLCADDDENEAREGDDSGFRKHFY